MLNKIKTEDLLRIYNGDLQGCIESNILELRNEVKKKEVYLSYLLSETDWSKGQKRRLESAVRQLERLNLILFDVISGVER